MKSKIILYIALMFLIINTVNAERYFVLNINYILGSVTFNSISLKEIDTAVKYTDKSGFLVKAVSFENEYTQEIYFNMSENKNYLIYIPYDKNTARIELYNPNNSKIIDIDVSSFADTCGNSVCEPHESYESCTKDCSSGGKDDFCDGIADGICDPDCSLKTDRDCEEELSNKNSAVAITKEKEQKEIEFEEMPKKPNYLIWGFLIPAIVVIISLIFFIKKRKENQTTISLKQYINENLRKGFTLQQIKYVLYREGYTEREIDRAIKSI